MRNLSDSQLLDSVDKLAVRGFRHEVEVVEHLLEVERRGLHITTTSAAGGSISQRSP